jgi:hypothetical protein
VRRIFVTSLVVACLAIGSPAVAGARRAATVGIDAFMTGLACTESGGRYDALNRFSGAMGKYQIMPGNWRAWGRRYIGNPWARAKPRHQEYIARERIADLYAKHGDWRLVAHWWRTGNAPLDERMWSNGSVNYVNTVMAISFMAARRNADELVPARCFPVTFRDPRILDWPLPRVWITGGRVNVRVAPGYEHRAIDVLRQGMRPAVLTRGEDARGKRWLKIGLRDGRTGWIAAWFTRPAD